MVCVVLLLLLVLNVAVCVCGCGWVVVVCEAVKVVFGAAIVEAADPGQPR